MIAQNALFSKWHSLPLAHLQTKQKTNGESFLLTPSPAMPWRFALDLRHQAWPLKKIPAQPKRPVTKIFSCCEISSCPYLSKNVNSHAWKLTPPKKQNHPKHMSVRSLKGGLHVMIHKGLLMQVRLHWAPDVTAPHSFNMVLQQCAKERRLPVIGRKHSWCGWWNPPVHVATAHGTSMFQVQHRFNLVDAHLEATCFVPKQPAAMDRAIKRYISDTLPQAMPRPERFCQLLLRRWESACVCASSSMLRLEFRRKPMGMLECKVLAGSPCHPVTIDLTVVCWALAQHRSEGPRNDPKWPPHHNASPLRAQNSHRATTRDRATIQNGHRATTPAHFSHKIRTAPQRETTLRSKMATAPQRQRILCTRFARRHNGRQRYDSKWPPRHNASPLCSQNSHRTTTGDHVTIQNCHRATRAHSIITSSSRRENNLF